MNSYRYFLIYNRNNQVIYGECINWRCGEFDSIKEKDVPIGLKQKFKARFIVSSERIDSINEEQKSVNIGEDISFHYKENYTDFVTLRSDEAIFSPLIDRCSKIRMLVGQEVASNTYQSWVEEHEKLLEDIKTKFDLDLLNRPELINTYSYYEPTRIVVNCRFIDKPALGESRLPTKLKVRFYDEFDAYTQASYVLTGYCEGKDPQTKEGKVLDGEIIVDFAESPDELEIKINSQGSIIYNSRYGFIKSIPVNCRVDCDTVTLDNGSKVSKYSKFNISIGKE